MKKSFLVLSLFLMSSEIMLGKVLVVDDFNDADLTNKLGGAINAWSVNPDDKTQSCKISIVKGVLKASYDIDSAHTYLYSPTYILDYSPDAIIGYSENGVPHTAFNGVYFLLSTADTAPLDLSDCNYLIFNVRGDEEKGYTRKFQIELKTPDQVSKFIVDGISNKWQKIVVPLNMFKELSTRENITELTVVFNETVTSKTGVVYFDNIYFAENVDDIVEVTVPSLSLKPLEKIDNVKPVFIGCSLGVNYRYTPEQKNELFSSGDILVDGKASRFGGRVKLDLPSQEFGKSTQDSNITIHTSQLSIYNLNPLLSEVYVGNFWAGFSPYIFAPQWGSKGTSLSGRADAMQLATSTRDGNRGIYLFGNKDCYEHQTFVIKSYYNSYSVGNKSLIYYGPCRFGLMYVHDSETAKLLDGSQEWDIKPVSFEDTYLINLLFRTFFYKINTELTYGKYNHKQIAKADYTVSIDTPVYNYKLSKSEITDDEMYEFKTILDNLFWRGSTAMLKYRRIGTDFSPKYRQEPEIFTDIHGDQKGYNLKFEQWYRNLKLVLFYDDIIRISNTDYYRSVFEYKTSYYGPSALIISAIRKYRNEKYKLDSLSIDKNEHVVSTTVEAEYDFAKSTTPGYRFPLFTKVIFSQDNIHHPATDKDYVTHSLGMNINYFPQPDVGISVSYKTTRYGDPSWKEVGTPFSDNYFNIYLSKTF